MKRLFFTLFLGLLCSASTMNAQTYDDRISALLGEEKYFELEREYALLKDSIDPTLRDLTKAMLLHVKNRPVEACQAIEDLIRTHQKNMDMSNALNMVSLWGVNLIKIGKYADAAQLLSSMLSSEIIELLADPYIYEKVVDINQRAQILKDCPAIQLTRSMEDCILPITMDKNNLMTIPVEVNGTESSFIIDTGADAPALISEDFARKYGVHILGDSVPTAGAVGQGYTKIGFIDSLKVGNITYRNVWTLVNSQPDIIHKDSLVARIDAVLGRYFIDDVGEMQILPKEKKIVFPIKLSETPSKGSNMVLFNRQPFVELQSGDEPMAFHFDTGGSILLYASYFRKHQDEITAQHRGDSISLGGFAGIKRVLTYKLPQLSLNIAGVDRTLTEVRVLADEIEMGAHGEGMLGMDFVALFDKVILNFREMFLSVE